MSRSEKSEMTYQKILDVSNDLFRKKGYGKTSIQDILNELKMSKGAVYHHFKSKKEILDAIEQRTFDQYMAFVSQLTKTVVGNNAKEKLTNVFVEYLKVYDFEILDKERLEAHLDPHTIVSDIKAIPHYGKFLVELLEEGKIDGSITTEHPYELAETFFMLQGVWLSPLIFKRSFDDLKKRVLYLQQMMKNMGADFITDEIVDLFLTSYKKLDFNNT